MFPTERPAVSLSKPSMIAMPELVSAAPVAFAAGAPMITACITTSSSSSEVKGATMAAATARMVPVHSRPEIGMRWTMRSSTTKSGAADEKTSTCVKVVSAKAAAMSESPAAWQTAAALMLSQTERTRSAARVAFPKEKTATGATIREMVVKSQQRPNASISHATGGVRRWTSATSPGACPVPFETVASSTCSTPEGRVQTSSGALSPDGGTTASAEPPAPSTPEALGSGGKRSRKSFCWISEVSERSKWAAMAGLNVSSSQRAVAGASTVDWKRAVTVSPSSLSSSSARRCCPRRPREYRGSLTALMKSLRRRESGTLARSLMGTSEPIAAVGAAGKSGRPSSDCQHVSMSGGGASDDTAALNVGEATFDRAVCSNCSKRPLRISLSCCRVSHASHDAPRVETYRSRPSCAKSASALASVQ
eukprot:662950-Pleurochrysis_carterae.AAC.2